MAQVETFHCPGEKGFSKSNLNTPGLQSGARIPCCITCCCCQEGFGLIHPLHSFVCRAWGAALSPSPHSQTQQPPRLGVLIHNPPGSHCGVTAGSPCPPGTAQGQHHHVGTLPAGLVAPACSDASADPGAAVPARCHRCLRSSRARRRDPNNQSTITASVSGQQEGGDSRECPTPSPGRLPREPPLYREPPISSSIFL